MFAAFVAGKLVQTDFQQVSETQFALNFNYSPDTINHIAVFLTGQTPFPDGFGGGVYFGYPEEGNITWHFLGALCNEKPSAIFKVNRLKSISSAQNPFLNVASGDNIQVGVSQLGISIEPLSQLAQLTPSDNTQLSNMDTFSQFSMYVLNNLVNYLGSFSPNQVPMELIQKWFEMFRSKMQQNPYFWK